jgi:hypothetical protein
VIEGRPKPRGFVETDVDAIKVIEKWMMEVDTKHIVPFLKEKRMIVKSIGAGCRTGWYWHEYLFRFKKLGDI